VFFSESDIRITAQLREILDPSGLLQEVKDLL
jgi:hypothetical protein